MEDKLPPLNFLGQYAGFISRLVAFVIDVLIIVGIFTITASIARLIVDLLPQVLPIGNYSTVFATILLIGINFLIYVGYFIGFWMLAGQTPGKALLGVRIIRTNGERLTIWRAIIRLIGYWISAILFLGYLWVIVDNRRQGFHDKLAGTVVVYSWTPKELGQTEEAHPLRDRIQTFRASRRQEQAKANQGGVESSAGPDRSNAVT